MFLELRDGRALDNELLLLNEPLKLEALYTRKTHIVMNSESNLAH
jgi:hypothetical protein